MDWQHRIGKYLRDGRVGEEANRLEREALSDPFLYEALEGLTAIEGSHIEAIGEIQQKIGYSVAGKRKAFLKMWWVAAAALLIFGGVALRLLYFREEIPQVVMMAESEDAAPVVAETRPSFPELAAGQTEEDKVEEMPEDAEVVPAKQIRTVTESQAKRSTPVLKPSVMHLRGSVEKVRTVEGVVKDEEGKPLTGVVIRNGVSGTMTDENGHFRMKVPDSARLLTASFIGKKTTGHLLTDKGRLQITMQQDTMTLDEVVVTGYVSKKIMSMTGSCSVVRHTDWGSDFRQYVADSLRYPEDAREQRIEGDVILSVHFNRKGRLGRIKVIRKLSPSCNREAIRLVQEYPGPWNREKGDFTLTIGFYLQENK